MTAEPAVGLELEDIQAGALQARPTPYAGVYVGLRIDDRDDGRELLRRLIPHLESVAGFRPERQVSLGVALTFAGLGALGVPAESLATFPPEFQQEMGARAELLGDVGENAPENWERPFGSGAIHVIVVGLAAVESEPARTDLGERGEELTDLVCLLGAGEIEEAVHLVLGDVGEQGLSGGAGVEGSAGVGARGERDRPTRHRRRPSGSSAAVTVRGLQRKGLRLRMDVGDPRVGRLSVRLRDARTGRTLWGTRIVLSTSRRRG